MVEVENTVEGSRSRYALNQRYALIQGESGVFVLLLLALGLAVRLIPAYLVYGSFDVGAWELVIREFRQGHNPYETGKLNWPPLWPILLFYTRRMEDVYNLPTHFSVKIIPCLADTAIALALYAWFAQTTGQPAAAFRRALWYALNPVAIATCALQGQFESLPSLFSLLAIMAAMRIRPGALPLRSAFWLGLAGMAKTWPLFLTPAFLRGMRSWSKQAAYVLLAIVPTVLSVGILYLQAPDAIVKNVLHYRGAPGQWGLTACNILLSEAAAQVWSQIVLWILYAAWFAVYLLTWRRSSVAQVACLGVLTFYVFTPGCGPQHHAWILAIAILADFPRARLHAALATLCLTLMYVYTPFNGEYFNFILLKHTPHFWATYLNGDYVRGSTLLFLPLWLFYVWWWAALLRDVWNHTGAGGVLRLSGQGGKSDASRTRRADDGDLQIG